MPAVTPIQPISYPLNAFLGSAWHWYLRRVRGNELLGGGLVAELLHGGIG